MHFSNDILRTKQILIFVAGVIAAIFLVVSHGLVRDLSKQEYANMSIWAEAMRTLNSADEHTDLSLVLNVINSNHTIPVIVMDSKGQVLEFRNIRIQERNYEDSLSYVTRQAKDWLASGQVIRMDLGPDGEESGGFLDICYDDSIMLKRLAAYPYIQLAVVVVFVLVSIFALLSSKKAEQNKVWVGLSKETAHQLGTPISSLMAWVEILRENYPGDDLVLEIEKDVKRLEMIAERFSKIGSLPELKKENVEEALFRVAEYIRKRVSSKVQLDVTVEKHLQPVSICAPLLEWVIENLCKNAVDAIDGVGKIQIVAFETLDSVVIEVSDTGKGIPRKNFQKVFMPGFTSKKRGWGLGLSLAKRIIEEYHKGRIYVKNSEIGGGTTFRIELKKY